MIERERIEDVISKVEAQRAALGDVVVDTTVDSLRRQLLALQPQSPLRQRKQVTVLFADLSGYTAMAATRDAEEVCDTMDTLWRRLDSIVTAWGGHVDKHMGDGMMALFGVPVAHEDDPERAVAAALAMQAALRALNGRIGLGMRIGISTGRVLLGPVGHSAEVTAVGDAVNVAGFLEQHAPVGRVLISHDVYRHVGGAFLLEPAGPLGMEGKVEPVQTYVVKQSRSRSRRTPGRGVEGVETHMIGRDVELRQLQTALQQVQYGNPGQMVTILGEAGIGKSRLRHEFKQYLHKPARPVALLEARADRSMRRLPYALIRDLLAGISGLQDSDRTEVARDKLVATIVKTMGDDAEAERKAHFIGHLIGLDFSDSPYLHGIVDDARQIRQQAFRYLAQFLAALAADQIAVLLLDDIHWADEGSLDLLAQLAIEWAALPLLVVCLARPALLERRPQWGNWDGGMVHGFLKLKPLSPTDSHQLVTEILRKVREVPAALAELIVNGAAGNPFYLEELIKMLVEDGAIEKGADEWRVQADVVSLRVPTTLTGVLQARLDRLPAVERLVLQQAAAVGQVFWESAPVAMGTAANQVRDALAALEAKEIIFKRRSSMFASDREYIFKHAMMREVVYGSVLLHQRRDYHARVAEWLVQQSGERVAEYAGLIAEHYELAHETAAAADWYVRAARQAKDSYAPETAIRYYRRALNLAPVSEDSRAREVELYGGLGEMLRWQARFGEAIEALQAMLQAAEAVGDLEAQVMAWKGLFLAHDYQGAHRAALESASGAERAARAAHSPAKLAIALAAKGWALMFLGEEEHALALGHEARALAEKAAAPREIAYSYVVLGGTYRVLGAFDAATEATEQALSLFRELGDRIWEGLMLHNLGQVARLRGDFEVAASFYREALTIARAIGDRYGAMSALSRLGKVARLQNAYKLAEGYYREALELAEKSNNPGRWAYIACNLGELFLDQSPRERTIRCWQSLRDAQKWFGRALQRAQAADQPVTVAAARIGLARMLLAEGQAQEALPLAQEALMDVRLQVSLQGVAAQKVEGTAWWLLAQVMAQLPAGALSLVVDGEVCDVADCFAHSLEAFDALGSAVDWERARTLHDWGAYLLAKGNAGLAKTREREAAAVLAGVKRVSISVLPAPV